ncbi:hypothetical protein [Streptococcus agalactiae]|uniref:hypothetical protein n=3 Tax=Bacteria TaxID=2 RepID=UPI0002BB3F2A|nr:hypothetical protein [Streptococcus agalactiae]EPT57709.1 hypothetical protein SAG0051_11140 [Streptococcus agalactiae CCUG 19094]EPT78491.1 hypothetical protein SAG0070_10840 [Streptococcus agalactiae CCUG 44077]EPW28658.1 hypothetical protein SAG0054_11035 [Streptococcus agalactiae CCUG 28551]EPW35209.1 hypothetical protein SAG0068_10820 [Streptococcus agalactiae CCUG 44050]EPW38670.1 hypothetical protein SAG0072_10625 [Streptococcus agalactiae CCUG 44110]
MNKKLKLTSAILSTSLIITPISGIINKNDNLAKAGEIKKENNNIQKHIEYIDTQIYLENNNLKINKNNILNYIKQNWNEININNQFKSPEDFYNKIQNSVHDLNKQVNSGFYKYNNNKGTTPKFQSRSSSGIQVENYWWGRETRMYDTEDIDEAVYILRNISKGATVIGIMSYAIAPLAVTSGVTGVYTAHMADKIEGWRYHGNCKLKVFWAGGYFTTDKLW